MNIKRIILAIFNIFISSTLLYAADENVFKKNNPDGMKYDFARSFIIGFGYLSAIDGRWQKQDKIKAKGNEMAFIQWNLDRLAKDNMDLRISKNYVTKYFNVPNHLMLKVIDSYAYTCDELIGLNLEERSLWNQIHQAQKKGSVSAEEVQEFVRAQEKLASQRKIVMRGVVEVSVLMTKVLLSQDVKEKQVKKRLALTLKERNNLIRKLDTFAGDNLDWGMKPGQTYVHAAVANIREVLEDPTCLSADE